MNCKTVKDLLAGYLAGDLEGAEKAGVLAHLKECGACRKEADLLTKAWQDLALYEAPRLGDDFATNLMRKIRLARAESTSHVHGFSFFGFSLGARTALGLATLVLALAVPSFLKMHKHAGTTAGVQAAEEQVPVSAEDREVIANLEVYENSEMLENMPLLSDLDVVEDSAAQTSPE